jgi:hypothetical protein
LKGPKNVDDTCTYQIEVRGQADENDLQVMSLLHLTVVQVNDKEQPSASTLLTIRTDQSGLIGLLRHLHARGVMLLAIHCER